MSSKTLKIAALSLSATLLLSLSGCSIPTTDREGDQVPAVSNEESSSPAAESPAEKEIVEEANSIAIPVSAEDLSLASSSTAPLTAVSGRYVVVEGYDFFDTLTVLEFDSGEKAYFATSGGKPFGNIDAGMAIAADQASRDLTGFGESVPADGPAGLDAMRMLSEHRSDLE